MNETAYNDGPKNPLKGVKPFHSRALRIAIVDYCICWIIVLDHAVLCHLDSPVWLQWETLICGLLAMLSYLVAVLLYLKLRRASFLIRRAAKGWDESFACASRYDFTRANEIIQAVSRDLENLMNDK